MLMLAYVQQQHVTEPGQHSQQQGLGRNCSSIHGRGQPVMACLSRLIVCWLTGTLISVYTY